LTTRGDPAHVAGIARRADAWGEACTIRVEGGEGGWDGAGALVMEWGTFRWSVPVVATRTLRGAAAG
jgi:hypothetical protein